MTDTTPVGAAFRAGDEVVLAHGTYQGTPGVFLRLREDAKWADITERNGSVRSQRPPQALLHAATLAKPGWPCRGQYGER